MNPVHVLRKVNIQCLQIFCYAVPHDLLKSVVLVFQALHMEIQWYCSVRCALTDCSQLLV
jgi:hypothetical protein